MAHLGIKITKEKNFRITLGSIPEIIRLKPKTSERIIPRAHVDWNQKNAAMQSEINKDEVKRTVLPVQKPWLINWTVKEIRHI